MSVINDFYAKESIFFHIIEGQLRQRVDLFIDFIDFADDNLSRDESVTAIIETDAGKFGQCVTKVELTREMPLPLIFWAPVVYPNIIDGTHKPIDAQIKITVDDNVTEKSFELGARRPWTVYALTDDCADFTWGYSGEETIKNSTDFIGAQLRWIEQTKDYPHEIQNRYNINQVMEAEWFRKSLPQNYFDLLIQAIKSGHMQLSPAYNSSNTAMLHTEQLVRTLYCGRKYESEYGIDISVAQEIESPVCTWGLASIFAGAGIKYLIRNWLNYYSPYCKDRDQPPLYKWVGPDGNGIIVLSDTDSCMKYGYKGARAFIKETYEKAVEELHGWWIPNFEKNAKYSYSALPMTGAYWDLNPSTASEVEIFVNQLRQYNNENWEYPKIINATWNQYFSHIEKQTAEHGLIIPEYRGDFGSAWEEWPAGLAHILSSMRCGINEYLAVETFSAIMRDIPSQPLPQKFQLPNIH